MTFTQDSKSVSTLSQDSRASTATFTQESKITSGFLWSSTIFPWQLDLPWEWKGNGQIITLDIRN